MIQLAVWKLFWKTFCFVCFWLCWVFAACYMGFSLFAARGSYSLVAVCRRLIAVASLIEEHGLSGQASFSSCSTWAQFLWLMGLVAPQHVGSSQIRDWICVSCTDRRILYHWNTEGSPLKICINWLITVISSLHVSINNIFLWIITIFPNLKEKHCFALL